jgi:hypothetical protein
MSKNPQYVEWKTVVVASKNMTDWAKNFRQYRFTARQCNALGFFSVPLNCLMNGR